MKLEKYTKKTGAFLRPMYRESQEEEIPQYKGERTINVANIEVSVTISSGQTHTFHGDETSQNRLGRTGWALQQQSTVLTVKWKTVDDTIVDLTVEDIALILITAGTVQSSLWF